MKDILPFSVCALVSYSSVSSAPGLAMLEAAPSVSEPYGFLLPMLRRVAWNCALENGSCTSLKHELPLSNERLVCARTS